MEAKEGERLKAGVGGSRGVDAARPSTEVGDGSLSPMGHEGVPGW